MDHTTIHVKNMVCQRCILAVEDILVSSAVTVKKVSLGQVVLERSLSDEIKTSISQRLAIIGFELIDNQKVVLIEKIKRIIIERARNEGDENTSGRKLSHHISTSLHHEYTYLSSLFSAAEGRTIEKYFIEQRVEKIKELLVYDELTLAQIAYLFDYSSTAYLSNQFKKVTGFNPTAFKLTYRNSRQSLSTI